MSFGELTHEIIKKIAWTKVISQVELRLKKQFIILVSTIGENIFHINNITF